MQNLIEHILAYTDFLQSQLHLTVTLHNQPDASLGVCPGKLIRLGCHTTPYCLYMKMKEPVFQACLRYQGELYARLETEDCIFSMCPMGVCEYIYAVRCPESKHVYAYVSVTGYRPAKGTPAWDEAMTLLSACADTYGLDRKNLDAMFRDRLSPELPQKSMLDAVMHPLCDLLAEVYRKQEQVQNMEFSRESRSEEELLSRVCCYIWDSYHKKVLLSDIAARFNYSPSYISHIFKSGCGVTINQYVNNLRITEAKMLLTTTGMPVQEISHLIGFSDSNYFSNVFRAATGYAPRAYRQSYAGTEETLSDGAAENRPDMKTIDCPKEDRSWNIM